MPETSRSDSSWLATLPVRVSLSGKILSLSTSISAIALKTLLSLAIRMSRQLEDEADEALVR